MLGKAATAGLLLVNAASVVRLVARPIREEIELNLLRYASKNCSSYKHPRASVGAVCGISSLSSGNTVI